MSWLTGLLRSGRGLLLSTFLVVGLLGVATWLVTPSSQPPARPDPAGLARIEASRRAGLSGGLSGGPPPTVAVTVDAAAGAKAAWWPKGEPPALRPLVERGLLPAVAERVGPEPLVMAGCEGLGRYGGTWRRIATSDADVGIITWRMSGATPLRWSPWAYPVLPHLAKNLERLDDGRTWRLQLRRGVRWSDGRPFTAHDVLYWWERDACYFKTIPAWMRGGGLTREDDLAVRFAFAVPQGLFPEMLAKALDWALPRHYLERFHPDGGDPALIAQGCRERGLPNALALYTALKHWSNPEHPRLWPWIPRRLATRSPYDFLRNPYFPAVDAAGSQLPYLDRVRFVVEQPAMLPVKLSEGGATLQERHLDFSHYRLLMDGREGGGYEVRHWYPATRSTFTIFPNLNRRVDPGNPSSRWKHQLLNDLRFRRALSLAIDREEIIRAEFAGLTRPSQLEPGPDSPFHHPRLAQADIVHDPAQANRLLDELGLTSRDVDGLRRAPDGTVLAFTLDLTSDYIVNAGIPQLLVDHWRMVGLRVVIHDRARALWTLAKNSFAHDLTVWSGESEFLPLLEPRNFVPTYLESFFAPAWGEWYEKGGTRQDPQAQTGRARPPPEGHPLRQAMLLLDQCRLAVEESERHRLFGRILDLAADNLWTISICTPPPQPIVVSRRLRNVPANALVGAGFWTPANAGIETFFLDDPDPDEAAVAEAVRAPIAASLQPRKQAPADGASWWCWLLLVPVLGVALVVLRHPFLVRRLLLMVPTLLVISVAVFVLIQLPPGDFLSARIDEMRMRGDEAAVRQAEELRQQFHLDEPQPMRYLRWLGVRWFTSFAPADRGLLQGSLGRSMEDGAPVSTRLGDRLALTLAVTLLATLITWAAALTIGVYSAVRQYSWGDHLATLLAFVGMSVPGFLLALVLLHLAHALGLSSSRGTGGLLVNLVMATVVLSAGGTAGLIRVMRGNLLDELSRPYVTAARARGLRPWRLLLKYPVRMALNPFISGLGAFFPTLVSGGAIVAMVLSIPLIGPLQISALMNEDLELAGAMLMLLALLGVVGTLVSDLLLLWLDPRIRLEGGR